MFTDLLRALADDRPRTMLELADELGADPAKLRLAFDHCERVGYLERVGADCAGEACSACSAGCNGDAASAALSPMWWRVTESGLRAARVPGGELRTT